jgi:DNA-binding beta-propeller fold protein YncE
MVTAGAYLVVANNVGNLNEPDAISIIRQATGAVQAEIEVGPQPSGFRVSPDGKFVYFITENSGELWVLNTETFEIDAVIPVKEFPRKTAISPDGGLIAITHASQGGVSLIDTKTRKVVQELDVEVSTDVAFSIDGSRLFVVGGDSIVIFDKGS